MTMPDERTRALVWAGAFLVELARNRTLPYEVRRTAVFVARHYPTVSDIHGMAIAEAPGPVAMPMLEILASEDLAEWLKGFPQGALTSGTRLAFPPEPKARAPRRKTKKSP